MGDKDIFDWIAEVFEQTSDLLEFVDGVDIQLPIRLGRVFLSEAVKSRKKAREEHRRLVQIAVGFARATAQLRSDDRERLSHLLEQEEFDAAIRFAQSVSYGTSELLVDGIHEVQRRYKWNERLNVLLNQGKVQQAVEFVESLQMFRKEKSEAINAIHEIAPQIENRKRAIEKHKRDVEKWKRKLNILLEKGQYSKAGSYVDSLPIDEDRKRELMSGIAAHELAAKDEKRKREDENRKRDVEKWHRKLNILLEKGQYSKARSYVDSLPIDDDRKRELTSGIAAREAATEIDKPRRERQEWKRKLIRLVDKERYSKATAYIQSLPIDQDTKMKLMSRIDDIRVWKPCGRLPPGTPNGFSDVLQCDC